MNNRCTRLLRGVNAKRADWRAKAYQRAARWTCTRSTLDSCPRCSLDMAYLHPAKLLAYTGACR